MLFQVSAGYSCAKRGQPGIYHRVARTSDWISKSINEWARKQDWREWWLQSMTVVLFVASQVISEDGELWIVLRISSPPNLTPPSPPPHLMQRGVPLNKVRSNSYFCPVHIFLLFFFIISFFCIQTIRSISTISLLKKQWLVFFSWHLSPTHLVSQPTHSCAQMCFDIWKVCFVKLVLFPIFTKTWQLTVNRQSNETKSSFFFQKDYSRI